MDVCCFDKTGTLTSDDMRVDGIAGLPLPPNASPSQDSILSLEFVGNETAIVLGSCHSLRLLPSGSSPSLIGDPMEKAAFAAAGWNMGKVRWFLLFASVVAAF